MNNFFKKTSTWAVIAVVVIAGMVFWAYKSGVFSSDTATKSTQSGAVAYTGQAGKTALELLKAKYQVETKSFASGEQVTAIDGAKTDDKHYWSFLVNGVEPSVAADKYVTKDGDSVQWQLKVINTSL